MDYKKAVQIIKDGGYATRLIYVEKLCNIIEKWNLIQYDVTNGSESDASDDSGSSYYASGASTK